MTGTLRERWCLEVRIGAGSETLERAAIRAAPLDTQDGAAQRGTP